MRVIVRGDIKRREWQVAKRLGSDIIKEFEEKEIEKDR